MRCCPTRTSAQSYDQFGFAGVDPSYGGGAGGRRLRRRLRHGRPRRPVRLRSSAAASAAAVRSAATHRSAASPSARPCDPVLRGGGIRLREGDHGRAHRDLRRLRRHRRSQGYDAPETCPNCRGTGVVTADPAHAARHVPDAGRLPELPRHRQDHQEAVSEVRRSGPRSQDAQDSRSISRPASTTASPFSSAVRAMPAQTAARQAICM